MGCINIIYDSRHSDDYERLLNEFSEQGITDFKFWDAVVLTDSIVNSIAASHKMIVQYAKDNGIKEICIAEQDLTFTCKTSWQYFMDCKPDEFDLYLWGSYVIPISNNIVCGFQLYIIKEKFYDKFLSTPKDNHIDTVMGTLKGDYKFCYPFPALQRSGFSANNREIVNYNSILKDEDIYRV
jgi:hypothetical protein